jgi:hypothetical protein
MTAKTYRQVLCQLAPAQHEALKKLGTKEKPMSVHVREAIDRYLAAVDAGHMTEAQQAPEGPDGDRAVQQFLFWVECMAQSLRSEVDGKPMVSTEHLIDLATLRYDLLELGDWIEDTLATVGAHVPRQP